MYEKCRANKSFIKGAYSLEIILQNHTLQIGDIKGLIGELIGLEAIKFAANCKVGIINS